MKSLKFCIAILALITVAARAGEFTLDTAHTTVSFRVKHLGISTVTGHFDKFSGTVEFDPQDLKSLKATATIEAASINTAVEKRDEHLRNPDFFDVAKFAQLTFASKEVKNVSGDKFQLVGDLTMHGVTKTITLDGEFGGTAKDPRGNVRVGFSASGTVNREDFGITAGQAGALVGKEIKIVLEVEAVQKK